MATVLLAAACGGDGAVKMRGYGRFSIETLNKTTPVKDQGQSSLCWAYAMLATIESDRLMKGDSVSLSPHYVARMMLRSEAVNRYTAGGHCEASLTATAPMSLRLIETYGAMPYDSYRAECNYDVLCRRINLVTDRHIRRRAGIHRLLKTADDVMDEAIGPLPMRVYMLGAEYTPVEFAHSVCLPGQYKAFTSFTHEPFWKDIVLKIPCNRSDEVFYNIPVDSLIGRMVTALKSRCSVCWEGDISEPGFSFKEGRAELPDGVTDLSQEARQRMFENFSTTDDHCMEIIGLAHDGAGRPYFVCKNSWGTGNKYGGLMFMSFAYARMKTIAAVMKVRD